MPDLLCEICQNSFYRKPSKVAQGPKLCSSSCRGKATKQRRIRTCSVCSNSFYCVYAKQACSEECLIKLKVPKDNPEYWVECEWCKTQTRKTFGQRGKNLFCSLECAYAFRRGYQNKHIEKVCGCCNASFFCLYRRQRTYCSKSCSNSGERSGFYGKGLTRKSEVWNKGLTKETSDKVAESAIASGDAIRNLVKKGLWNRSGALNSNHNSRRNGKPRSKEQLDKYSKASIQRVINGQVKNPKTKHGSYTSTKTLKEMKYKSSYEETYMLYLDNTPEVIAYNYEPFIIKYDECKRYVPDFLVEYKDGSKELVEIKGMHLLYQQSTKNKIAAGKKHAEDNGLTYKILTNKDILEIRKRLCKLK